MSVVYSSLYWLLLAVPIVSFYLLKVRLRRVPVATLQFWGQVYDEKQPRALWRQLRNVTSLLLQLLFLVLIVAGLCDPHFASDGQDRQRVVVVLDNSASMSATDVVPTRFQEAQRQARVIVAGLRSGDEMAVVTAGSQPRVACGLTSHPRTLERTINAVAQTEGPTAVREAVNLADRLLAGHPQGRIVVLSDGCFAGAEDVLRGKQTPEFDKPRSVPARRLKWQAIGNAQKNVAITRFQVRRSVQDPLGFQVFCEVRNFGREATSCRLELALGETLIDVIPLKLEAGGQWSQTLEQTAERGGELVARIDHVDVLAADNIARAVLPRRKRLPVTLVSTGNVFLQRVFEANSWVDLTVSEGVPSERVADDILVLHRQVPAKIPAGNVLMLQPETGCSLWELGERLDHPLVGKQDKDSPLLANVRLDNVLMPEARLVRPTQAMKVLIESANGEPLLLLIEHERGRALVLTVNLERGDLTLRTAFPILVSNALSWFEGGGGELREALATGMVTQLDVPASLLTVTEQESLPLRLRSPRGVSSEVVAWRGKVNLGPLHEAGIWTLDRVRESTESNESAVLLACNLTNPSESDLQAPLAPEPTETPLAAAVSQPLWFYWVLLAWVLTGAEWALHQRRVVS